MNTMVDRYDLSRWTFSALMVASIYAAVLLGLTKSHEPVVGDAGTDAIFVELAPVTGPPTDSKNDLAPGPEQQQTLAAPDVPKVEEKRQEKIESLPRVPDADVRLPDEIKPPDKAPEAPSPPVPQATSPPKPRPSVAQVASWHRKIALQVERHKGYPASARANHETGVAELAFTIDRTGKVVTSRVVRSSGIASLDQETIDTVRRAQPFPPPPANMPGETFDFTVPIRFNIR